MSFVDTPEKIVRILLAAGGANQIQARVCAARKTIYEENSTHPPKYWTEGDEANERQVRRGGASVLGFLCCLLFYSHLLLLDLRDELCANRG